ncbi:MAG: hypothetical protein K2G38_06235 [Clostridia bacterium]|nr:hypothetical protein [Clostridia bacterium]
MIKKLLAALLAVLMFSAVFCGCKNDENKDNGKTDNDTALGGDDKTDDKTDDEGGGKDKDKDDDDDNDDEGKTEQPTAEELLLNANYTAGGYVSGKISDFSVYENTAAYRKVTTAEEFITAIADAKYHYKNVWDDETSTYTQEPADGYTEDNFEGTVHVIEIANDLNLGYYKLSDEVKSSGLVDDFGKNIPKWTEYISMSDMVLENGVSQIKVENTSNLLIYSKNGAKLTHCGFKLTSDTNVVFRNLTFDEMWQWEDAPVKDAAKIGDYDWFGWAYFKISFCGYIWIDHCTFGKSYDGQIDYSNPVYNANAGTAFRAPYGADGSNGLHISWCNFNAGSDDENGYLYKMMSAIEADYQSGGTQYLYYNALREGGASFEDILYGIAIPQKKGFLCGDNAKFSGSYDNADDYNFNLKLRVSFANCTFKNLEDRLPKLRGGNAYMYNCIVDSSQYYGYRTKLRGINAASIVSRVNSGWKCGLVSQGIVCGNGGSVKAENCIFRGIEYLLKNNDTNNSAPYSLGGYQLVNCSYQQSATSTVYTGSSSDTNNLFTNSSTSTLTTDKFEWHTEDKAQPFTISAIGLENLEDMLKSTFEKSYLKSSY